MDIARMSDGAVVVGHDLTDHLLGSVDVLSVASDANLHCGIVIFASVGWDGDADTELVLKSADRGTTLTNNFWKKPTEGGRGGEGEG
jgi:hypothetical protein